MMTQDELWNQLAIVHDSFCRIYDDRKLLDIALELSEDFSEENFDRIRILIECFSSRIDNETDRLKWTISRLDKHLSSTRTEQLIDKS